MTAKRFDYTAYDDGTESIYDRKKDKYYFDMQLSEIEELMNELADENEQLKQQMQRLYNYFADWFDDRVRPSDFSEMWDFVKEDEKWD